MEPGLLMLRPLFRRASSRSVRLYLTDGRTCIYFNIFVRFCPAPEDFVASASEPAQPKALSTSLEIQVLHKVYKAFKRSLTLFYITPLA